MRTPALLLVLLAGCAAVRPATSPMARVGSAEAAVRMASARGADRVPHAARHLALARDEVARARRLIREGDYQAAESFLVRAEADAQVAEALAREADAGESVLDEQKRGDLTSQSSSKETAK